MKRELTWPLGRAEKFGLHLSAMCSTACELARHARLDGF